MKVLAMLVGAVVSVGLGGLSTPGLTPGDLYTAGGRIESLRVGRWVDEAHTIFSPVITAHPGGVPRNQIGRGCLVALQATVYWPEGLPDPGVRTAIFQIRDCAGVVAEDREKRVTFSLVPLGNSRFLVEMVDEIVLVAGELDPNGEAYHGQAANAYLFSIRSGDKVDMAFPSVWGGDQ